MADHLCKFCSSISPEAKDELNQSRNQKSVAGGGKKYWARSAAEAGITETQDRLAFVPKTES